MNDDTDTTTEPQRPESYPAEQWEALMPASRQWVAQHWEPLMAKRVQLPEDRAPQTYPPDAPTIVGESPSQDASVDMFGETVVRAADVVDPEALPEVIPEPWDAPLSAAVVEDAEVTVWGTPVAVEVCEDTVPAYETPPVASVWFPSLAADAAPERPEAVDGQWSADEDERPTSVQMGPARLAVETRPKHRAPKRVGPWLVVDVVDDVEGEAFEFALLVHDVCSAWAVLPSADGSTLYVVGDGAAAVTRWQGQERLVMPVPLNVAHELKDVLEALAS